MAAALFPAGPIMDDRRAWEVFSTILNLIRRSRLAPALMEVQTRYACVDLPFESYCHI